MCFCQYDMSSGLLSFVFENEVIGVFYWLKTTVLFYLHSLEGVKFCKSAKNKKFLTAF